MLKTLEACNAVASAGDVGTLARVISIVWNVVGKLSKGERQQMVGDKDRLRGAMTQAFSGRRRARLPKKDEGADDVEHSYGTGLGERTGVAEGRARLDRYVKALPLETWAGPTAGAGEIEDALGIPRSTLSNWRNRGTVVGLLHDERKLAYPLEQFVDARPVQGISDVLKVAPDERAAWLWLRQPHAALQGNAPLDVLKAGGRDAVARVAERDFA
jgi:hypothetical protein